MPQRWKGRPPPGFDYIEPILLALENELRDKVAESNVDKRNVESGWPVLQIQNQRSRYIYDMFYVHKKISRKVYDYCLKNKLADANLIAKWKKPGYEKLCSTYVINPKNFKFGTTSICRVPLYDRNEQQKFAQDPTTGCMGCASGKGAGPKNIFGNKYGQRLAAVQIAREEHIAQLEILRAQNKAREEEEKIQRAQQEAAGEEETDDSSGEEDYGPAPTAGIWAKSKKLEKESEKIAYGQDNNSNNGDDAGDEETEDESDEDDAEEEEGPPMKKIKS